MNKASAIPFANQAISALLKYVNKDRKSEGDRKQAFENVSKLAVYAATVEAALFLQIDPQEHEDIVQLLSGKMAIHHARAYHNLVHLLGKLDHPNPELN